MILTKNQLNRIGGYGLILIGMLFAWCMLFSFAKSFSPVKDSVEFTKKGTKIALDKALLARACNKEETKCLDNVVLVIGKIDQGTINSLIKLGADITTICFRSQGGSIDEAVFIGNYIRDNTLNTCLAEKYILKGVGNLTSTFCDSACPFLLVSGENRIRLGDDFKIRIHHSGGEIDCVFCSFKFNASTDRAVDSYRDMLKRGNRPDSNKHIKMLKDSLLTHFRDANDLSEHEINEYAIFNVNK